MLYRVRECATKNLNFQKNYAWDDPSSVQKIFTKHAQQIYFDVEFQINKLTKLSVHTCFFLVNGEEGA